MKTYVIRDCYWDGEYLVSKTLMVTTKEITAREIYEEDDVRGPNFWSELEVWEDEQLLQSCQNGNEPNNKGFVKQLPKYWSKQSDLATIHVKSQVSCSVW